MVKVTENKENLRNFHSSQTLERHDNYASCSIPAGILEQKKDISSDNTHQPKLSSHRAVVEPVEFTAHQNKGERAPWSNMKCLSKRGLERT